MREQKTGENKAAAYKVQLINICETYVLEKLKEIMKVGLKESPTIQLCNIKHSNFHNNFCFLY